MEHGKTKLEALCFLDHLYRGSRRPFRMADEGRNGTLPHSHHKAAAFPSRYCVSHCLEYFVCPDGSRSNPYISLLRQMTDPAPWVSFCSNWHLIFLEYHIFQPVKLRTGPALAGSSVGADFMDDQKLSHNWSAVRLAADPLFALGYLCRISEFWRVAAQLIDFPN